MRPQTASNWERVRPQTTSNLERVRPKTTVNRERARPKTTSNVERARPKTTSDVERARPKTTSNVERTHSQTISNMERPRPQTTSNWERVRPHTTSNWERVLPQTTSNIQRVRPQTSTPRRFQSVATAVVSTRRTARSARARLQRSESPPPDLNPPVWTPLICEMNMETLGRRPDSGYETLDGYSGAHSSTGSDDDADDEQERDTDHSVSRKSFSRYGRDLNDDEDANKDVSNMEPPQRTQEENEKILKQRPRTNSQLKNFLSAAMDSVRFFLVTSSIGQANKKEQDNKESESESESSDDEPQVKQLTRSELLIMNGALMEPPWRFTMETYKEDQEMLAYYTGFTNYEVIKSLFEMVKPGYDTIKNWISLESPENIREGAFKSGIITLLDEFFMFLYKLRHNPSNEDLSIRFSMPVDTVQGILDDWLHYLFTCFGHQPVWPTRDNSDCYMPRCYKSVCPCARGVVHVAKVKVKCPQAYFDSLPPAEVYVAESETDELKDLTDSTSDTRETPAESSPSSRPQSRSSTPPRRASLARKVSTTGTPRTIKPKKIPKRTIREEQSPEQSKPETKVKDDKEPVSSSGVKPDKNDVKHYKCIVIYQPTGAACLISKLYPHSTTSEQIIQESGFLPLLEECDDVVTVDKDDNLNQEVLEEMLHPYAANYMNINFLTGCMPMEEFRRRSPMKAHHVRCMRWHVYHSVDWIRKMKVWDDLAELPLSWVNNIERVWRISCLLTNFLPSLPCLDIEANHDDLP